MVSVSMVGVVVLAVAVDSDMVSVSMIAVVVLVVAVD
jgi:hypothetical protein